MSKGFEELSRNMGWNKNKQLHEEIKEKYYT